MAYKNKHEQAAYAKAWYEANKDKSKSAAKAHAVRVKAVRRLLLAEAKRRPCMDCGGVFPTECMDFDHVRGSKRCNVSAMLQHSVESVLEEISKCEVVCANCHRIRTHRRLHEGE